MDSVGSSKVGLLRENNEDYIYVGKNLFIVADGMGGYNGGEIASELAIEVAKEELQSGEYSEDLLRLAVTRANKVVFERSQEDPERARMGTTMVIAARSDDTVYWANVGDSRLYLFSKENGLKQISKDHSYIQELIDANEISPEERKTHPKKNYITRAVGAESKVLVDTGSFAVVDGTILLLCSDGLSSLVDDEVIASVLKKEVANAEKIEELMTLVYDAGARDNVSIVLATM